MNQSQQQPTSLGQLESDINRLRETLSVGDLAAPVPGCPGWTLADLGSHVAAVYRVATVAVVQGRGSELVDGPRDRPDLLDWFHAGAQTLLETLAGRASDAPCWTVGPPSNVGFWVRRMCHETALHLWDAQASQGEATPIGSRLAADGLDEVVNMLFPRQILLGRMRPLTDSLQLSIDDSDASPLVIAGNGTAGGWRNTDAAIAGPAESLLLLLWKRKGLSDDLTLTGDRDAANRVLDAALTP